MQQENLEATNEEVYGKLIKLNLIHQQLKYVEPLSVEWRELSGAYTSCQYWFDRRHIRLHLHKETNEYRFGGWVGA